MKILSPDQNACTAGQLIPASRAPNAADSATDSTAAFGRPRDFTNGRFVYTAISPRARGLSVGVNMNPDKHCNFNCVYCEVNREVASGDSRLDVPVMIAELERTLAVVTSGGLRDQARYRCVPLEFLELRHVALSGDGEPTICPNFCEAIEALVHFRAIGHRPFFKLVLITNGTSLDRPEVIEGLRLFTARDEVWAKLDAGTQQYMNRVNRSDASFSLERIQANILSLAQRRPVVIQSLFPAIDGAAPPASEIEAYVQRIQDMKEAGGQIALVQIYSATRPTAHSECGHLPLRTLSDIARRVREVTGLKAEVF